VNGLAERLMQALSAATRRVRIELRRHSGPDLTVSQFRALRYVQRHPRSDLTTLASHLGMSPSSASALVERLRRAGYVDRMTDPVERRRMRIDLTASGAETVSRAERGTRAWLSGELDALSATERRELVGAVRVLARLGAQHEGGGGS
jgi:DNA-binding MarR family transcriptional regulator